MISEILLRPGAGSGGMCPRPDFSGTITNGGVTAGDIDGGEATAVAAETLGHRSRMVSVAAAPRPRPKPKPANTRCIATRLVHVFFKTRDDMVDTNVYILQMHYLFESTSFRVVAFISSTV